MAEQKRIKSGAFSRGFALARMSAAASARAAGHLVGNIFASEERRPERLKELLKAQAQVLAREMGALKGSVMKVGQMLSVYGERLLPPEANAVLKSLQNQSPPLEWAALEPVLTKHLGAEKLADLEIDHHALASASLGQVHLARVKPGSALSSIVPEFARDQQLAMKIQYPGVDQSIDSDLSTLKSILSVSKLLPAMGGYEDLFSEVREMLHQETDYEQELHATVRFREQLVDDPRFIVPRVVPELSSARVLTTEFLRGLPVDSPEVQGLSQERRDALGLAMLELFFRELYVLHRVQTDPHFGNYRVRLGSGSEPDQIVLLDFGAVREFQNEFLRPYFALHRGAFLKDQQEVTRGATGIGFMIEEDSVEMKQAFAELTYMIAEPFNHEKYDWADSELPKRVARGAAGVAMAFKLRSPPREIVFLDRKLGGVFIFLSVLRVKASGREILHRYLANTREL